MMAAVILATETFRTLGTFTMHFHFTGIVMRVHLYSALTLLALCATCCDAQFGGMGMGMGGEPEATAVKSDLPYIRCQVCETLAKNAYRQVKTAQDALKPGKKVSDQFLFTCF